MGEKEGRLSLSRTRRPVSVLPRSRAWHNPALLHSVRSLKALIGGEWKAIVRYDTAHRRPHKDILRPNGTQKKQEYRGYIPMEDSLLEN